MKKHVYSFGGGSATGTARMKDVPAERAPGLAEMSRAICPFLRIHDSTEVCNLYFQSGNKVPLK